MANRTIAVAGGPSNVAGTYDENAVPTTAVDDVVARGGGDSGAFTIPAAFAPRSIDLLNYAAAAVALTTGIAVTVGAATAPASNVLLRIPAGKWTTPAGTSAAMSWNTSAAGQTVTSGGNTLPGIIVNGTGEVILQDDLTLTSSRSLTLTKGTLRTNGKAVNIPSGNLTSSNANTRTLDIAGSTVSVGGTSSMVDCSTTTGLTVSAAGSRIIPLNTGSAKIFKGGGLSWGTLAYTSAGTGSMELQGANTFEGVDITGAPRSVIFPAAAATTITSLLRLTGTSAGLVAVQSSTGGSAATLTAGAGVTVVIENASVKDLTCGGGATFVAVNSVNVSGNTGITFQRRRRGFGMEL